MNYPVIKDTPEGKVLVSPEYNYVFEKKGGGFCRWGKTPQDDPEFSPFGPEILDIEISTICTGGCKFCYKGNTSTGKYMSLETFRRLLIPPTVTQIAFGIGDIEGNPDLFPIMHHTRSLGIVPNITVKASDVTEEVARKLANTCGAVAVSLYNKEECYTAVRRLQAEGLKQANIHMLLSEDTFEKCIEAIEDIKNKVVSPKAIVFLWLKPVGRAKEQKQISEENYKKFIEILEDSEIPFGFDSCSASLLYKAVRKDRTRKLLDFFADSCESSIFSYYVNVDGIGFPCSFTEQTGNYKGINLLEAKDFLKDVWYAEETISFRVKLLATTDENKCRSCPVFNLRCS